MRTSMTTHQPRVSVGLPVFNGSRYLSASIDSILAQTFTDFELIISDNGSTDDTEAICTAYAAQDARIRYVRAAQNAGGAWNFRRVVELSSAPYFKWHSHDDLCAPELLERCVEVLDSMPEVILCYGRTMIVDEDGQPIMPYEDQLDLNEATPYQRYKHYHERFRTGAACNVHYGLIRKQILDQTPLIGAYSSSDLVLIGELALRGRFCELPERLFLRRDHPDTTIRLFPTEQERLAWFEPVRRNNVRFPILKLAKEHLASIRRVPMTRFDRLRCDLLVVRYLSWHFPVFLSVTRDEVRRRLNPSRRARKA